MKNKTLKISVVIIFILGSITVWYFDLFHSSVEPLDELIGKNYDHALVDYFKDYADDHYSINIHDELNEFDGGIWKSKEILSDSIVNVYTWHYSNHKKTIWVGKTAQMDRQVIDAIRYKNSVRF